MNNDKFNRCIKSYVEEMKKVGVIAHTGRVTIMAIMNHIPKDLLEVLTADQIGKTMAAAQKGYLAAKGELMGLELVDGDVLWIPGPLIGRTQCEGVMVPLSQLGTQVQH